MKVKDKGGNKERTRNLSRYVYKKKQWGRRIVLNLNDYFVLSKIQVSLLNVTIYIHQGCSFSRGNSD